MQTLRTGHPAAASIRTETLEFFALLGGLSYEGFGVTETTGVVISQPEGRPRFGTVGKPIEGCELRLADGRVHRRLELETERCCNARVAQHLTTRKFRVVTGALSVDTNALTATMKVHRPVINEMYAVSRRCPRLRTACR